MKKHDLFIGRFQPFHNGHLKVVKQMVNPIIAIVSSEKSEKTLSNNPFDLVFRVKMIKQVVPNAIVIVVKDGYIPNIIEILNLEIDNVFAGTDRLKTYTRQLKTTYPNVNVVEVVRSDEDVSATKVRKSLIENDFDTFKNLMPLESHKYYEKLRKGIKSCISQSHLKEVKNHK